MITAVVLENVPLVPVTVRSKEPTVAEVHERGVCVVGGVIEPTGLQLRPTGGIAVKDTVLVKPFRGVIVIVVEQVFPTRHGTVVGVEGEMSKLGTGMVTVIVAFWVKEPLVPVMFTRYVPGATLLAAIIVS